MGKINAKKKYEADLNAKRALKEAEKKKQKQLEEEKKQLGENEKNISKIEDEIETCKVNISVANDLILKAQKTIESALNEKNVKSGRTLTQQGLSELQVGNDRKRKFDEELAKLEKKKKKLLK